MDKSKQQTHYLESEIVDKELRTWQPMIKLSKHMSLSINHNEHKNYYELLKEYIDTLLNGKRPSLEELSEEQYKKCLEMDEFWEVRWYPETPISFNVVYGSTLEECLKQIREYD